MRWAVGQSQFEWLAQRKHHQELFNSYMSSRREGKPSWFDVYPVERLTQGALEHDGAVFLVDVGGNQGHDLIRFREKFPGVPGRFVLQDLPKVVASAPAGEEIEAMAYSFLDPQPVKGTFCVRSQSVTKLNLKQKQAPGLITSVLSSTTGRITFATRSWSIPSPP